MKKLIWMAAIVVCCSLSATAQDCNTYYLLQNNKVVETTIYNKKGAVTGKQVYTISDVKNSGGIVSSTLQSEMFDKKGKSVVKSAGKIQCKDGIMMMDIKMMLPQQQQEQVVSAEAKTQDVYIEYPSNMKVGDELKDASFNMDMQTGGGLQQSITMVVNNRKVEATEPVTTSAGTWNCFKISYKSKITMRTAGIGIPMNIEGSEWYAPGFGIVKTESKHGSTAITAIK